MRSRYPDEPLRLSAEAAYGIASPLESLWLGLQEALAPPSAIPADPIFVMGHWRSGTTLLHELLACDPRFCFPSTYACMNPQIHRLTESSVTARFGGISSERPMDTMRIGVASPQEDEFALLSLGAHSPYEVVLFPRMWRNALDHANPLDLSPPERNRWVNTFERFVGGVASLYPSRRIILKSPTHSFRVDFLRARYPKAAFICMARNPLNVFSSTVSMWRSMWTLYSLTPLPTADELEQFALTTLGRVNDELCADAAKRRDFLRWYRFEDLVDHPHETLREVYESIGVDTPDFDSQPLASRIEAMRRYERRNYAVDAQLAEIIFEKCAAYASRFGYSPIDQATNPARA